MKEVKGRYAERGEEGKKTCGLQGDLPGAGDAGCFLECDTAPAGKGGVGIAIAYEKEAHGVEEEGKGLAQHLEGRLADDEVFRRGEDGFEHG